MQTPADHTTTPRRRLDALLDCLVDAVAQTEAERALAAILERQAERHDPERRAA